MITETQREELIELVQAANLVCPEQVGDMVLDSAERGGYEAGVKAIEDAKKSDADSAKSLGIEA